MSEAIRQVRDYHERSKHHLDAYAKGPEFLDWDQQPDPFRRFAGATLIELPLLSSDQLKPADRLDLATVAALLEHSMGLSAWKQFGPDRWALRCNPSSGNLHPTEAYVIASALDDLPDGVYHYAPRDHALEQRGCFTAVDDKAELLIGLSSIFWREAWKYGERAYRYVQLDVGHALGALRYAAKVLGLKITLLPFSDASIARLLGLDRASDFTGAESEHPDLLLQVEQDTAHHPVRLPVVTQWYGSANQLGGFPKYHWDLIDKVAAAASGEGIQLATTATESFPPMSTASKLDTDLLHLIKQRRSAQAFNAQASTLAVADFYNMLDALLPRSSQIPWDSWQLPVYLHPVLFVHRVEGLDPGLYMLPRCAGIIEPLKAAMKAEFTWQQPESCPAHLPLYQLLHADTRKAARTLCCHQEIASSSAFSLGMLAEFDNSLEQGAQVYRHLYWEAGLTGQVLYLQAEAIGMRGTGIGCFFDDGVHQLLGLSGTRFQSLYHFTVGNPKIDERLETLPPYYHLAQERQGHDGKI